MKLTPTIVHLFQPLLIPTTVLWFQPLSPASNHCSLIQTTVPWFKPLSSYSNQCPLIPTSVLWFQPLSPDSNHCSLVSTTVLWFQPLFSVSNHCSLIPTIVLWFNHCPLIPTTVLPFQPLIPTTVLWFQPSQALCSSCPVISTPSSGMPVNHPSASANQSVTSNIPLEKPEQWPPCWSQNLSDRQNLKNTSWSPFTDDVDVCAAIKPIKRYRWNAGFRLRSSSIPLVNTAKHGGQIKSLWERNYGKRGSTFDHAVRWLPGHACQQTGVDMQHAMPYVGAAQWRKGDVAN